MAAYLQHARPVLSKGNVDYFFLSATGKKLQRIDEAVNLFKEMMTKWHGVPATEVVSLTSRDFRTATATLAANESDFISAEQAARALNHSKFVHEQVYVCHKALEKVEFVRKLTNTLKEGVRWRMAIQGEEVSNSFP